MPTNPFDRRPSDAVRTGISTRARDYLDGAVEEAYQADLDRWARDDEAPFPNRAVIRARLEGELIVLCHGLGSWAAAHPAQFFRRIDRRILLSEIDPDIWDS
jgi:hypothetical protein